MGRYYIQTKSKRELREERRRQVQKNFILRWGGLLIFILVLAVVLTWAFTRPLIAVTGSTGSVVGPLSRDHIPEGTDPGAYATNPPAGGHHFPSVFQAGFYTEEDTASMPQYPQGYLVHNLEHGYVIYWYNCQADPSIDCAALQDAIKQVIKENNTFKVIGYPWPSQNEPLVITSWGRIMRLNEIDLEIMRTFYNGNVDKGPEKTVD